jgi:hypothetical protein
MKFKTLLILCAICAGLSARSQTKFPVIGSNANWNNVTESTIKVELATLVPSGFVYKGSLVKNDGYPRYVDITYTDTLTDRSIKFHLVKGRTGGDVDMGLPKTEVFFSYVIYGLFADLVTGYKKSFNVMDSEEAIKAKGYSFVKPKDYNYTASFSREKSKGPGEWMIVVK